VGAKGSAFERFMQLSDASSCGFLPSLSSKPILSHNPPNRFSVSRAKQLIGKAATGRPVISN